MPVYNTCRCGGSGRRTGLKILRDLPPGPVRFRPAAPEKVVTLNGYYFYFMFQIKTGIGALEQNIKTLVAFATRVFWGLQFFLKKNVISFQIQKSNFIGVSKL